MTDRPFRDALDALRSRIGVSPEVFWVLGSGLGGLADGVEGAVSIPFDEVPGFPRSRIPGHAGRLVNGTLEGRRVLVQAGRFHLYEGHPPEVIVAPLRLAADLGARIVILTNAAGGIRRDLVPGSLLLLEDHLNLMGRDPLVGTVGEQETRFPDLSSPFDTGLQDLARSVAADQGIPLRRGVYAGVLGPSYETPAEVRFLERAGADAVGMSTVPEAIAAAARGLSVLGLSVITNRAAGMGTSLLTHEEVLAVGREAGGRLGDLIRGVVRGLVA
jgi:purine-nucleoside phosphorylase